MLMRTLLLATFSLASVLRAQDTTAAKASLLEADWAAARDTAAWRRALAPRATVLAPGRPVLHGAEQYEPALASLRAVTSDNPAWTPVLAVVARDGSFGCTTGIWHVANADTTRPSTGRYLGCWRRTRREAWRLVALSVAFAPPSVRSLPPVIERAPASGNSAAPRRLHAARAMAAADRAFAQFSMDSGGPAEAFSRWVAADGMMLAERAVPVRGPEEVRQAFAGYPTSGRFEWGPIDSLAIAARDGSLGLTIGQARNARTPTSVTYTKYLTVWRREPDGTYRWIFDTGSARPAP
ncbi:MAG: nuclear transport factor 2 family protein [Gemmatimonadetes bacterium]|nr:nuclear transport factor 2 family protein [Gemmatimonadota bacterium]